MTDAGHPRGGGARRIDGGAASDDADDSRSAFALSAHERDEPTAAELIAEGVARGRRMNGD